MENMAALKRLMEADTSITVSTLWRDFKNNMRNNSVFLALDRLDRLQVFEDHIR